MTSVPQTHPPGSGWRAWDNPYAPDSPLRYRMVEAWRKEWQDVEVLRPRELPPWFNISGLMWRPLPVPLLEPEAATSSQ